MRVSGAESDSKLMHRQVHGACLVLLMDVCDVCLFMDAQAHATSADQHTNDKSVGQASDIVVRV
jgi:hypothetical protein